MPGCFENVLKFCEDKKIKVDFNQGLDSRLVNQDIANLIIRFRKYIKPYCRFAFDSLSYRDSVERVLNILKWQHYWYVYCDNNWESALERVLILKRYKQSVYLMRDKEKINPDSKKHKILAHWVNCLGAMRSWDFFDHIQYYNNPKEFVKTK